MPETSNQAEPNPESQTAPQPEAQGKTPNGVLPRLVQEVHELNDKLGREEAQTADNKASAARAGHNHEPQYLKGDS
jgi:hypothetical protein